jgi:hypothetical protein
MRFNVGDTIRNRITQEVGKVVRLADKAYVVLVTRGPPWHGTKEALWRESEVTKVVEGEQDHS